MSYIYSTLIGSIIGFGIAWGIQGSQIKLLETKEQLLITELKSIAENQQRAIKEQEKAFDAVLAQANIQWKEQESTYTNALNRMRNERDSARSSAMSRIASSSRSPNELCFSRNKLESAIGQLDESLSGIIGQCLDTETRLNITKQWYNSIKELK